VGVLATEKLAKIEDNIAKVIIGKSEQIRLAILALLARGHILIEDVPGVGKTMLARALARSIDCSFSRVQFTPDLLPSDVIGVSIYDETQRAFRFYPGPVFSHIVLADEINRTTPRTQSCLLEAMNDFQVTADGTTHRLSEPFMVMATENPIEYAGTYPLPESQLDRFLLKIELGYPGIEAERRILSSQKLSHPIDSLSPVVTGEEILELQRRTREVQVEQSVSDYILKLVGATRDDETLRLGASPRASLMLYRAAQAIALMEGRKFVIPDDVKRLAVPVLSHRLIERTGAGLTGRRAGSDRIREILDSVPVPI